MPSPATQKSDPHVRRIGELSGELPKASGGDRKSRNQKSEPRTFDKATQHSDFGIRKRHHECCAVSSRWRSAGVGLSDGGLTEGASSLVVDES